MRKIVSVLLALCLGWSQALASQATLVTPSAPLPMTGLASFLNAALLSLGSHNSGASAPANGTGAAAFAGESWINTTSNPWAFNFTDNGANWAQFGSLNTTTHAWTPYFGAPGTAGQLFVGQSAAQPSWVSVTGDCVIAASGALTCPNYPITPQDYGATGNGVTDDTAALVAWAAASGTSNLATYCPPGVYLTTQTVAFMPFSPGSGVTPPTWRFDKRCIIRATAAMTALVQFGNSASNFSGIIRNGLIEGGVFDANFNALVAAWVPFYNDIIVRDSLAENAIYRDYRMGDANSPQTSYGATFSSDTWRTVTPVTISGITKANPAVVQTSTPHGLTSGQVVYLESVTGMTQVNNLYFTITFVDSTHFSLNTIDSTGYGTFSAGTAYGAVAGLTTHSVITGVSTNAQAVVTTSTPHGLVAGQSILLYGLNGLPGMSSIDGLYCVGTVGSTTFNLGAYAAPCTTTPTAVNTTGLTYTSGGIVTLYVPQVAISAINTANPVQITTATAHGLTTGNTVFIDGIVNSAGPTIYGTYIITVVNGTAFTLNGVNGAGMTYTSGGGVRQSIYEPLYGVCFEHGGDNTTSGGNIVGSAIGIGGCGSTSAATMYDGSILGTHIWNPWEEGELIAGIDVAGDYKIGNAQVDGPFRFAYRFRDQRNNLSNSNVDYGGAGTGSYDGASVPIRIDSGGGVAASHNSWKAVSNSYRLLAEASVALADRGNYGTSDNKTSFTINSVSNLPHHAWAGATTGTITMGGATHYLGPAGSDTVANNSGWAFGGACTVTSFYVATNVAPGGSDTYTYTLMYNGNATPMTVVQGSAAFGASATGTVPVQAFDTISIRAVGTGSAANTQFRYVVQGNC